MENIGKEMPNLGPIYFWRKHSPVENKFRIDSTRADSLLPRWKKSSLFGKAFAPIPKK